MKDAPASAPLLPVRLRVPALVVAVIGWLVMVALGLRFAGEERAGGLDRTLIDATHRAVGNQGPLADFLVSPTDGIVIYGMIATLIVVAIVTRRWEFAVLAVSAPSVAVLLVEAVLKPLFDRRFQGGLSYPSGHTVSFVTALSAALLVVLALMAGRAWLLRALFVLAWFVVSVVAMVGLVAMNYHYPTDAVGGFCVALGVVLPCALLSDSLAALAHRHRARSTTPSTATAPSTTSAAVATAVTLPEPRSDVERRNAQIQRAHD